MDRAGSTPGRSCTGSPFDGHERQAHGAARSHARHNCPWCSNVAASGFEAELSAVLLTFLPEVDADGDRLFIEGRVRQIDLLIPRLRVPTTAS